MIKFLKSFFITIFIIILLFVIGIVILIFKNPNEKPIEFVKNLASPLDNISFLILGQDSLNENKKNVRSDVIILAKFNLKKNKMSLISIPRDTRASIMGKKDKEKINHAFRYGGSELSLKAVNELLKTNVKYYLTLDYKFVKDIVNALGGVEIDIPMDMDYDDDYDTPPLHIHLKKGIQKLNGDEAIKFLRFRHGYEKQDLQRVEAQRKFIKEIIKKTKSLKVIAAAPTIFNSFKSNVKTNIPFSSILKMSLSAKKMSHDNIQSATLPGKPKYINKVSYIVFDPKKGNDLLKELEFK